MRAFGTMLQEVGGGALRTVALLLVIAAFFMLIIAVRQRRKAYYIALQSLLFAWSTYFFLCLLYYGDAKMEEAVLTKWTYTCPWGVILALECVSTAIFAVMGIDSARHAKSYLWSGSIKHAIDALPVAVCVGNGNTVHLVNVKMNEICVHLFGKAFASAEELWEAICRHSQPHGDSMLVRGNDTTVQFVKSQATIDEKVFEQITAYDVTEQYRITKELQEKHDKLKEVQLKQLEVRYQTEALARSKELLNARVLVHDEIGHILLLGKYYFEHVDQSDEALLEAIRQSSSILSDTENEQNAEDAYQEAVRWARSIGIDVKLVGHVPRQTLPRQVVAQAVKECATNAVKHADAHVVEVKIEQGEHDITVVITNDGEAPKGDIAMSGGLLSLNRAVEEANGTMAVQSAPSFVLTVNVPI